MLSGSGLRDAKWKPSSNGAGLSCGLAWWAWDTQGPFQAVLRELLYDVSTYICSCIYIYIYIYGFISPIFTVINIFGDGEFHWLGILIDGIIVNLGQGAETSFKFFNAAQRAKYQFL